MRHDPRRARLDAPVPVVVLGVGRASALSGRPARSGFVRAAPADDCERSPLPGRGPAAGLPAGRGVADLRGMRLHGFGRTVRTDVGLMGAGTEIVNGPVAISAKSPESWRETIPFEPPIKKSPTDPRVSTTQLFPMACSIVRNVINGKENFNVRLATFTGSPIGGKNLASKRFPVFTLVLGIAVPSSAILLSSIDSLTGNAKCPPATRISSKFGEWLNLRALRTTSESSRQSQLQPLAVRASFVAPMAFCEPFAMALATIRALAEQTKLLNCLKCLAPWTPACPLRSKRASFGLHAVEAAAGLKHLTLTFPAIASISSVFWPRAFVEFRQRFRLLTFGTSAFRFHGKFPQASVASSVL